MNEKNIPVVFEPIEKLTAVTGKLQGAWWDMRDLAATHPSRELSLAITNAQQALMWLVECSHMERYHIPAREGSAAFVPDAPGV